MFKNEERECRFHNSQYNRYAIILEEEKVKKGDTKYYQETLDYYDTLNIPK